MPITAVDTSLFPLLFAEKDFPEMSLQFQHKLRKTLCFELGHNKAASWKTIETGFGAFFSQQVHVVLFLSFVAAWLDLLIWSRMRNSLITERSLLRFPTFRMCIFVNFKVFAKSFFCRFWPSEYFFLHFQIHCREKIALLQKMTKTSDFSRRSEAGN